MVIIILLMNLQYSLTNKIIKKTIIGNNNYFMNSTTIDHDCELENNIILSSNVTLGGMFIL